MTDELDCGHTEDDHRKLAEEMQERITGGDITALIPAVSNEMLNMLLQAAAAEVFVRSENFDAARRNWEQLDSLIRTTLFVDSAEESAFPVEYTMLKEANKKYLALREADQFAQKAGEELDELFDQHGVADAKRPQAPTKDEDFPGFYL